jgi:hypothetical protein
MVSRCPTQGPVFPRKSGLFYRQGADRVSAPTRRCEVATGRDLARAHQQAARYGQLTNAALAAWFG